MNGARQTLFSKTNLAFKTRRSKMPLETRLAQAHVMMLVIPKDKHDLKSVSLARYGAYEVRLVEPPSASNTFAFWIELFDHSSQIAMDSGGTDDFEEALAIIEYFVSCAEGLSKKN